MTELDISLFTLCLENADNVAGLKGRVKAARDKTKGLLTAVNGTLATLNAMPNGKIAQSSVIKGLPDGI